jgi:hypothetical protein
MGITGDLKGNLGLTGAISGCPAPMMEAVLHRASEKGRHAGNNTLAQTGGTRSASWLRASTATVRACPVNTCEGGSG